MIIGFEHGGLADTISTTIFVQAIAKLIHDCYVGEYFDMLLRMPRQSVREFDPAKFDRDGYAIIDDALTSDECESLIQLLVGLPREANRGGIRNLIGHAAIASLVQHPSIVLPVQQILGPTAFAYKATLFEKTPDANWLVTWHQDTFIPLASRADLPGWSGWCVKAGTIHARPPAAIMEQMLAVRIHLDASTSQNGSLRVLPASHMRGYLSEAEIANTNAESNSTMCLVPHGGLLLMRPLILHASSKSVGSEPRRVIHFEFSNVTLPSGLDWPRRVPIVDQIRVQYSQ